MFSPNIHNIVPNKQQNPVMNIHYKSETAANPNESIRQDQLITTPVTPFSEKRQNGITKTYLKKQGNFSNYIPALYTNIQNINQSLANNLMSQNIFPHISERSNPPVITQKPDTLETQRSKALTVLPDYKVVQYPYQPPTFDDKLILEKGPKHTSPTTDVLLMEKINLIRNNMYYNTKKTNNKKQIDEKTQNLKSGQNTDHESPKKVIINGNLRTSQSPNVQHNQNTKKEQDNKNGQNVKTQQKHNSSGNTNSKENNVKNAPKVQSKNNISKNTIIAKESSTKNVQNVQNKKDKNSVQNTDKEQANNKNVQKEKKTQNIKESDNNNKSKVPHPEGQNAQNLQNVQEKKITEKNGKNEKKEGKLINNNTKQNSGKQSNQTLQQKHNISNDKNSVNAPNGNQKSMSVQNNSLTREGENNNKSKMSHPEGQSIRNSQNIQEKKLTEKNSKNEKKEEKLNSNNNNNKQDSGKQSINQTPQQKQSIYNAKNSVNAPNGTQKSISVQNYSSIKEGENNKKSKIPHPEGQSTQNSQNVQEKKLTEKNNKNERKEEKLSNNNAKQDSGKQDNQTPQQKQNTSNTKNSVNAPNNSLTKESGNNNKSKIPHPEGQNIQNLQNVQEKISKNEKKEEKRNDNNIKQDSGKQSNQTPQNKQDTTTAKNSVNVPNGNKKSISKSTPNSNNSQNSTPNKNKNPNTQIQSELTNEGTAKNTNTQITEIYKCNTENFIGSSENLNDDDTALQKKQIQEVPLSNKSKNMEQIPSALMQTKTKEFFKKPTAKQNANTKTLQSTPKTSTNTKAPPKPSTLNSKRSSTASTVSNHSTRTSNISIKSNTYSRNTSSSSSASFMSSHRSLVTNSNTSRRGLIRSSLQNIDPVKVLKEEVQRAIRARKTFTVRGFFYTIRKALRRRGWIEKFHLTQNMTNDEVIKRYQKYSINELVPLLGKPETAEQCKDLIRSKLLGAYQVDFYWAINVNEAFRENPDKIKLTIINKLKRDIFSYTNKQGLCDASKDSYWYQKKNVSKLNHPRSYSLAAKTGDVKGFIEDFRVTAAMSLLKWIIKTSITKESKLISPSGKIPLEVFDFAINECCKFIKKRKHEDIDTTIPEASEKEWDTFLDYFYKIIHYSNHFTEEKREKEESLVRKSNYVINTLREVWPYTDMDGMMNIWIMKPVASSRGRGIHMCRTLQYALKVLKDNHNVRYIIQKYIERPLLIHNTKFDIRQWFLISNCSPLTIWIYKHCYLRFSSQTYNLRKLHESIHLTNNSVQCKYQQNFVDTTLPSYNMWDSNQFKTYLANIGYPNAYKNIIYPGMKQCITAAVLMHQDKMLIRKNCFELFGADFILTEDFQPWLLEINSNPALQASTPVTSRMCPRVLEDVIKVIIDYSRNVKADTGGFELMYKQQIVKLPAPAKLEVTGKPLNKNYFNPSPDEKKPRPSNKFDAAITPDKKQDNLKNFTEEIKKTLKNLLNIIHEERLKRERQSKNDKGGSPLPTKVQNKQIKT